MLYLLSRLSCQLLVLIIIPCSINCRVTPTGWYIPESGTGYSHGFVHADWTHLIVNMFTFLSFGVYVENQFVAWGFGSSSFLILYFGGMVAASVYDVWKYRNNQYYSSIGASGAVSAVLFTAIFLHPWDKIYFFAIVPIPGIVFGFIYLLYCQYMAKRDGDNINHNAHFYGAVFGLIFPVLLEPRLLQMFIQQLLRH